jgi:hypothetical protein
VSRVEWSRRTADEIETVLGIMLCRDNPSATRVRPSRGDKGVDVYIPSAGGWTVYQVKSFTGSLTSSHKRQIRNSWDAFAALVQDRELRIQSWYLMRPENPTWPDEEFLRDLTEGAEFPRAWRGLDHCEALAANHPSVIDYYLFDGKERLQEALRDLMTATSISGNIPDLTTPADATRSLEAVHAAINAHDPHYRYDFSVTAYEEGRLPAVYDEPGLVAATIEATNGRAIIFKIFARYREATSDSPVPGQFTLVVEPGTAEAEAVRDFYEYGMPVTNNPAQNLRVDLPGGLGSELLEGFVSLGAARLDTAQPSQLQLAVLDPHEDLEIAVADLDMDPPTTGLAGRRFAVSGQERYGIFSIVLRVNAVDMQLHMSLTSQELTGKLPADVLPGLYTLAALHPPNRFLLRVRNGSTLDGPRELPRSIDLEVADLIPLCESLAAIQRHALVPVRVPDFTQTPQQEAREWMRVARLLNGDTLEIRWDRVDGVKVPEDSGLENLETGVFSIMTGLPLTVTVGGIEVDLGMQMAHLKAAHVDPTDLENEDWRSTGVAFVPAGDNTATVRWVGRSG